jgi:HAD superfamily hydrolase (TIGR01509 family)
MGDAYAEVLRSAGVVAAPGKVASLVRRDQELLIENATLFSDTLPFLKMLRRRRVAAALVSNCAENTRPLLAALGLIELVDAVVLSCEVGYVKPAPEIYRIALDRLGAPADEALLVDDQAAYCAGGAAVDIATVRIDRAAAVSPDSEVIRSLEELRHLLDPNGD